MIQAVDAHPTTGSPNISLRATITNNARKEHIVIDIPNQEAICRGICEKLAIPSIAYPNSFQKHHFISLATRSALSYDSQQVLYPIQLKSPFEILTITMLLYLPGHIGQRHNLLILHNSPIHIP